MSDQLRQSLSKQPHDHKFETGLFMVMTLRRNDVMMRAGVKNNASSQ